MKSVGVWFVCDLVKWKGAVQVGNNRCKTQCRGTGNRKRRKGKERDKVGGGLSLCIWQELGRRGGEGKIVCMPTTCVSASAVMASSTFTYHCHRDSCS